MCIFVAMKVLKNILWIGLTILLWSSCDLFRFHPYEGRFEGEEHLTRSNLKKIERLKIGSTYRFAFISDTQRHYDETDDVVRSINSHRDIRFVIHGGDLTDFGVTEEFVWMRDCLLKLNTPWFTVIGNHDFLGNGEHIYQQMFGDYNYAFTVGHTRFEMLNTVALELDYSTPVPDFSFLENEINYLELTNTTYPDSIRQTIFVMHSRPGDEQFNNNVLQPFDRYLQLFPAPFCLNGHNHRTETIEPYDDGILFHGISSIKDRQYYIITIKDGNCYEMEVVDF